MLKFDRKLVAKRGLTTPCALVPVPWKYNIEFQVREVHQVVELVIELVIELVVELVVELVPARSSVFPTPNLLVVDQVFQKLKKRLRSVNREVIEFSCRLTIDDVETKGFRYVV